MEVPSTGMAGQIRKPRPRSGPQLGHRLDRQPVTGPVRRRGSQGRADLVAGHAIDALAEQIRVAIVTRVLLDHVQVDPPDVAIGAAPPKRHDIIEAFAEATRLARRDDLAPVDVQVSRWRPAASMSPKSASPSPASVQYRSGTSSLRACALARITRSSASTWSLNQAPEARG